ncbi:MAG TPA: STAS domain-containing protein [Candidatus Limnocylindrales bacterium]|jgi:anti-anti-sigma factor|nr:STAS domain-containing protein [Candidatus Limnocylindrales bacterium]
MPSDAVRIAVRQDAGTAVVAIAGRIDASADEPLRAAVDGALATTPQRLILDFSAMDYMNSTGIALVVGLLGRARATQTPVGAYGLSPHYQEIFRITRLSDFLPLFDDEAGARAGLAAA